jgi:hypothetical protein
MSSRQIQILTTIAKIIGNYKFIQAEYYIRRQNLESNKNSILDKSFDAHVLIKYLYEIMTEYEKIRLKSFNIVKNTEVINKHNKNNLKKYYSLNLSMIRSLSNNMNANSLNLTNTSCSLKRTSLISNTVAQPVKNLFIHIKEIELEFISKNLINKLPIMCNKNYVKNKFYNILTNIKRKNEITNNIK